MITKGRFFAAANYALYYMLTSLLFYLCVMFVICAVGTVVLAALVARDQGLAVMLTYRLELGIGVSSAALAVATFYLRRWSIRHYRTVVWPRQTFS
jgi:hypothetical protein